ncbi:ABC transporter substrate-binding protein [bacterium]|nr:ABC transporter substrate-binding protein [bacterium]MDB2576402.1 ABC transporter substrate-binding protein [Planctomycetota bacterium]
MRIVSLLPSSTEIVHALGLDADLVGISHECDFPASVTDKPVLTSSKIDIGQLSADIDRDVRRVLTDALAVYDVDAEGLERARPDVVLTQDLCDVCAVSIRDVEVALQSIASEGVQLVSLRPTRLDDLDGAHGVMGDIERVAEALGAAAEGKRVADGLRDRLSSLRQRAAEAVGAAGRPRVLTIEWIDPVMVGGTWMPELVEIAGGEALVTEPGQHAPTLDRDALAALDPEVVLIKPCGFDLQRTRQELGTLHELIESMPWRDSAKSRTFVADGNAFFNRPGPRLVESAEILAAMTHPSAFPELVERHGEHYFPLRAAPSS